MILRSFSKNKILLVLPIRKCTGKSTVSPPEWLRVKVWRLKSREGWYTSTNTMMGRWSIQNWICRILKISIEKRRVIWIRGRIGPTSKIIPACLKELIKIILPWRSLFGRSWNLTKVGRIKLRMELRKEKRKKIRGNSKKRRRKKCNSGIEMRRNRLIKLKSWALANWSWRRKKSMSCRSSSSKNKCTASNLKKKSRTKQNKYKIKLKSYKFRGKHWKIQIVNCKPKQKRSKRYRNNFSTSKHNTKNAKAPWPSKFQPQSNNRTNSTKHFNNLTTTTNSSNLKLMRWVNSWRTKLILSSNRNLLLNNCSIK